MCFNFSVNSENQFFNLSVKFEVFAGERYQGCQGAKVCCATLDPDIGSGLASLDGH